MFSKSRSSLPARVKAAALRDAPPAEGSFGWAKSWLGRREPVDAQRSAHAPSAQPADAADAPASPTLLQLRNELGSRLLVHDPETQAVRNLYVVHQELARGGWTSVAALPRQVTGRAYTEAEILQLQEPSPLLELIVGHLRDVNMSSDARTAEGLALDDEKWEKPDVPEVSETSYQEYELMERSWIGTVPQGREHSGETI